MIDSELAHSLIDEYRNKEIRPSDRVELLVTYEHKLEKEIGTCLWEHYASRDYWIEGCSDFETHDKIRPRFNKTIDITSFTNCPYCGKPIEFVEEN
jgi:hypothetical protein